MILDNGVGGSQTETVSFRFGGEVRIKNPFHVFFRNTHAFVANSNAYVITRRKIGDGNVIRVVTEIVTTDVHRAAIWHRLVGVDHQVGDELTDLAGVDLSRCYIAGEFKFAAVAAAAE